MRESIPENHFHSFTQSKIKAYKIEEFEHHLGPIDETIREEIVKIIDEVKHEENLNDIFVDDDDNDFDEEYEEYEGYEGYDDEFECDLYNFNLDPDFF